MGYLLDAHVAMLGKSRFVRGVERRIGRRPRQRRARGADRDRRARRKLRRHGRRLSGARASRTSASSARRLLRNLTKTPYAAFKTLAEGTIILAEELSPADTALMDPRQVAGFATVLGGAEGHTAIMARALNTAGGAGRGRAA